MIINVFQKSTGIVGEEETNEYKETPDYYLWTHKKLDIGYNGNRIVDVNLTSESKRKLIEGAKIGFTYEVNWKKSNIKFEDRFDKYLDPNFFQHRVSKTIFAIFNVIRKNFSIMNLNVLLP